MKTKTYEVQIYYSGFTTNKIEAKSEEDAIIKARLLDVNKDELLTNIENWEEADKANEIESNIPLVK